MHSTNIGKFCAEHDNWEELLQAEPYCLKVKRDSGYTMFSYNQIRSDFNEPVVREARGIIFRTGKWENPVCWAFNKFGNYGESYVPELDWSAVLVTEKIDGSLIKLWWDEGDWWISTNGAIDAFKAPTGDVKYKNFGSYFYATVCDYYEVFDEFLLKLDKNLTYMFELVGPSNRVVIPYKKSEIYFLGARNKFTGQEFFCTPKNMCDLNVSEFNSPTIYFYNSLEECVKAAEEFGWDQEGFVACDENCNRVKIKSPAYILAHYMRNNNVITRKHIIRVILENETAEFLCYAVDYKDELIKVQELMNAYYKVGNELAQACRQMIFLERKDYAKLVQALPKIYQGLLYMNYDRFVAAQEYTSNWNENKWDTHLESFEELTKDLLYIKE